MLEQRRAVTKAITNSLVTLEEQVDAALVQHAHLQVALIEGRRAAKLPLDAGQAGLDKVTEAAALLVAARKAVNEAHYEFRALRDQLGLPTHAYGDTGDTPDFVRVTGAAPDLALVRAA